MFKKTPTERFATRLERVVNNVSYKNWRFIITQEVNLYFVHVEFIAPDANTGAGSKQQGRKWFVEETANDQDIIRTLHKAVLAAMEHEVDEFFRYKEVKIFDPHKAI